MPPTSPFGAGSAPSGGSNCLTKCVPDATRDSEQDGPKLRGVFGRVVGTVEGFPYSEGLKSARLTWDEPTLDKWLTDPAGVLADNDMGFRLENAEQRADIIAYLKGLGESEGSALCRVSSKPLTRRTLRVVVCRQIRSTHPH